MADHVFNIAKGAAAEMVRDDATNVGILLLSTTVAQSTMEDYDDLAAMLAGTPVEVSDASYSRKTGLTATLTVDDTNNRVDLDLADQTWSSLSGPDPVSLVVFYENSASDANRIPLTHHDFAVTSDGSDVTAQIANFFRAA